MIGLIAAAPFKMSKEKRVDDAIAVSIANYGLVNGSFDYDIEDGEIRFRLTTGYTDCEIGEGFFMDMMATGLITTDKYSTRFLMLSKDVISLEESAQRRDRDNS